MTTNVEQLQALVSKHRQSLISAAVEQILARVPGYGIVEEDVLRRDLGRIVDAVVVMADTDDTADLYERQLESVRNRIERGVTLPQYLEATLSGFQLMRRFADEIELPFEDFENVWVMLVRSAAEAYSQAHQEHIQALERQRSEAEAETKRLRALSELVAGVAHEINTPLGVIIQAASVVREELPRLTAHDDPHDAIEDVADAVGLIEKNVQRVDALVQSFKSLSVHQHTDDVSEIDLEPLVRGAIAAYRSRSSTKGLAVDLADHREDPSRAWFGHGNYLTNILISLLVNVERYAYDQGQGAAVVELHDHPVGVRVVVADRGRGIPAEHREKLFDPFFTTGRRFGASGLGLSIVHNLVTQAMGGAVQVESSEGRGTRVLLDLPLGS